MGKTMGSKLTVGDKGLGRQFAMGRCILRLGEVQITNGMLFLLQVVNRKIVLGKHRFTSIIVVGSH